MIGKGIISTQLRFTVILLGLIVALGFILAAAEGQVKATSPSNAIDTMPPPMKRASNLYISYDTYIAIVPSAPTPDDVIRIAMGGEWPNSCVPRYKSHQIEGSLIRIIAEPSCIFCYCLQVIMPWSFVIEVGSLPVGLYTVEVRGSVYKTTTFMVTTERLFLPVILNNP